MIRIKHIAIAVMAFLLTPFFIQADSFTLEEAFTLARSSNSEIESAQLDLISAQRTATIDENLPSLSLSGGLSASGGLLGNNTWSPSLNIGSEIGIGVRFSFLDGKQFTTYGGTLITIILLALLLVFAVMAAQFESLIDPFIIFATIPMLLIGVVWVHIWAGQDFTLYSIVGIIALIGVVVNNGIVMVDSINQLVRAKTPIHQACMTAARTRLRPILMTTLTTVLGMVPMAFFPKEGASSMQPIALTFVGGLLTGSFMTLFLSPILYTVFNRNKERRFNDPNAIDNQIAAFDAKYGTVR